MNILAHSHLVPRVQNDWEGAPYTIFSTRADYWITIEESAAMHGTVTSRDHWRLATRVYLADSRDEAWRDVEASNGHDMEYFAAIRL